MRTFIAFDLTHRDIEKVLIEIKKAGADIKYVEPHNLHVTLKFLGEIEEKLAGEIGDVIEGIFKRALPLKGRLGGVGVYPGLKHMRVLWIGLDCPELEVLQKNLDEILSEKGFKKDRDFKPHLTIGRVRSGRNKDVLRGVIESLKEFRLGDVDIRSVKLKKSDLTPKGPIYTDLKVVEP